MAPCAPNGIIKRGGWLLSDQVKKNSGPAMSTSEMQLMSDISGSWCLTWRVHWCFNAWAAPAILLFIAISIFDFFIL